MPSLLCLYPFPENPSDLSRTAGVHVGKDEKKSIYTQAILDLTHLVVKDFFSFFSIP